MRQLYVYILATPSRRLYIGVTRDLRHRIWQHRTGAYPGFSARYGVTRLVYHEGPSDSVAAIVREKQIKRWTRRRKQLLIERQNLGWLDLAVDWFR